MSDTSNAVYLFGNHGRRNRSINAKFHSDKWELLPTLKWARHSHASVTLGKNKIIVVGKAINNGSYVDIWDFETDKEKEVDPSPKKPDSYRYKRKFYKGIALFPVTANFCKK